MLPIIFCRRVNKVQTIVNLLENIAPASVVVICKNSKTSNFLASLVCESTEIKATSVCRRFRCSDALRSIRDFESGKFKVLFTNAIQPLTNKMHYVIYYDCHIEHFPQTSRATVIDIQSISDKCAILS